MTALAHEPQTHDAPQGIVQPALFVVPTAEPLPVPARPVPVRDPQVRLTRRGRLAVFGATVASCAVMAVTIGSGAVASGESSALATTTVQVLAGDTLWDIASEANPGGDIRATMDDIITLNALPAGSSLPVGAHLDVPVYE